MVIHDIWTMDKYTDTLFKITYIKAMSTHRPNKKDCPEKRTDEGRFSASISRAKGRVLEYALCNKWSHFCTFTLDENLQDRYDLQAFAKRFTQLIADLNRDRENRILYLLIPEQHKDGAWHMHGLIDGLKEGEDLVKNEHGYLNWDAYSSRFGFFNASRVRDAEKCATYVSKYVTKSFLGSGIPKGAHLYYASRGLNKKERVFQGEGVSECPIKWTVEEKKKYNVFENDYTMSAWLHIES